MPATRTRAITITLPVARWETLLDGLDHAAHHFGGPGWCIHPEAGDYDLCDSCLRKEERADTYRKLAYDIGRELTHSRGRVGLVFTEAECATLADGLRTGAAYVISMHGVDCLRLGADRLCDACASARRQAAVWRVLAARAARRAGHTHARSHRPRRPAGTRARTGRR
ncbi:hypothetical protein [Microtetraspora malaysiensis]|uniref:Uncharacterized protein n=1 Tax=Microtetraspora malaysiensis TaxID=161358 RepID=A0ABW6SKD1_9ACTN